MNKQSLLPKKSPLLSSWAKLYPSIFSTSKDRFPKIAVVLLALTMMGFHTSCTSKTTGNFKEDQNLLSKQLKKSDPQLSSLNIAMSPSQSSEDQKQKRQLLADYLQEKLEIPVVIETSKDYDTAIDLIVKGKVQMAYLGPFSYVKAREQNPLIEPLVAYIDTRTGRPWYTSAIVADTQSGIQTLKDLKGKRLGFVNQASTSGYLVPVAHLISQEINPETDFATVQYAGSHNKNARALESGEVDAIGINKPTLLNAQKSGQLPLEKYQMIWESDPIPNAPIVISRQLPASLRTNLKKALINAPSDLAALSGAKSDGYTLVSDEDYAPIRKLQKILEIENAE